MSEDNTNGDRIDGTFQFEAVTVGDFIGSRTGCHIRDFYSLLMVDLHEIGSVQGIFKFDAGWFLGSGNILGIVVEIDLIY